MPDDPHNQQQCTGSVRIFIYRYIHIYFINADQSQFNDK